MGNSPAPAGGTPRYLFFISPHFFAATAVCYWYGQINQETIKTKNNAI